MTKLLFNGALCVYASFTTALNVRRCECFSTQTGIQCMPLVCGKYIHDCRVTFDFMGVSMKRDGRKRRPDFMADYRQDVSCFVILME
jgi:hypothetical protein